MFAAAKKGVSLRGGVHKKVIGIEKRF